MRCNFFMILLYFIVFLEGVFSFTRQEFAFNGASFTAANIYDASLSSSGQINYVIYKGTDHVYKMKKFNTSTGSLVTMATYQDNLTAYQNSFFIYSIGYVFAIGDTNQSFSMFSNNGTYHNRLSISQYVTDMLQSTSQNTVIYVTTGGTIGSIEVQYFPSGSYKTILASGLTGNIKVKMSPDTQYLAVGTSTSNKVILISLASKAILVNWTLSGTDTRAITWKNDSSTIYVATQSQGKFYILSISSPYSQVSKTYENANNVTAVNIGYASSTNQLIIYTYKNTMKYIYLYSYYLSTYSVYHIENYTAPEVLIGMSFDDSNPAYYVEWSNIFQYFRKLFYTCNSGYYWNTCTNGCVQCTAACSNCTFAGCIGSCNTTTTNTTTNTTLNSTIPANTTNTTSNATNTTLTNVTNSTNATFPTNITTPIANATNTTNITNTINTTNITNPANTTNTTIPQNSTIPNITYSNDTEPTIYDNFATILQGTLGGSIINSMNYVPGGRRFLQPLFTFFINFDDLWLYIYHERDYDIIITSFFSAIQDIESQKWNLINYQKLWSYADINTIQAEQYFNNKYNFTSYKFIDIESNANGFFQNTLNFFLSNMIFTCTMFVILRLMFYLFFRFKISILLREYSFWPYLAIMLLDGNIQYMSYLVGFQIKYLFNSDFYRKIVTLGVLKIFYLIVIFSTTCHFLFRYVYGELSKYFFDNCENQNSGAFYMMAQFGIRNIILGFLHIIIDDDSNKLLCLFSIQLCFFIYGIFLIRQKNVFVHKTKAWINIIACYIRLIMIGMFYYQGSAPAQQITITSPVYLILMLVYVLLGLISILYELICLFLEFSGFLKNNFVQKIIQRQNFYSLTLKNKKKMKITLLNTTEQIATKGFKLAEMNNENFIHQCGLQKPKHIKFKSNQNFNLDNVRLIDSKNKQLRKAMKKSKLPFRSYSFDKQNYIHDHNISTLISKQGQNSFVQLDCAIIAPKLRQKTILKQKASTRYNKITSESKQLYQKTNE